MKIFYDHLIVELNEVYMEIEQLEVESVEKKRLNKLVDQIAHHHILDTILQSLDKNYHKSFLNRFYKAPYDKKNLYFLKEKIADVEEVIYVASKKLKKRLLKQFL